MARREAPALGADTEDVLRELGYSKSEVEALEADGTIMRRTSKALGAKADH